MPALEALSAEVRPHVAYPRGLAQCPDAARPLLAHNRSHVWVRRDLLEHHNATTALSCCYRAFVRPKTADLGARSVDDRVRYGPCARFTHSIAVGRGDEFVQVECRAGGREVYTQFFLFAPEKPFAPPEDGVKEAARNASTYNVLVLGIDNVSRLNFRRTMPRTLAHLVRRGAVELLGYNKVGDNSYPNVVALLTGLTAQELSAACSPGGRGPYDQCPFVWHAFRAAGFRTAMAEDSARLATFNYLAEGFVRAPADYYARTFVAQAERRVGTNVDFNAPLCMHDRYFYRVLLEYAEAVTRATAAHRLFGFFWEVSMSHDYANYPMAMDGDYARLLARLEASGYLEETVVLVVSDHGIRWGPLRATRQGRLEERLPLAVLLAPEGFRRAHPAAFAHLRANARRLTTPFDVHATLLDLAAPARLTDASVSARARAATDTGGRGVSLFLPVPVERTCEAAGVGAHWCACHRRRALPLHAPEVEAAAAGLVRHLNRLLRGQPQCAPLRLAAVEQAGALDSGGGGGAEHTHELVVAVRAEPGRGLFEGTLRREAQGRGGHWAAVGPPSRLNLYGEQSHCVRSAQLKLYCYCLQPPSNATTATAAVATAAATATAANG